MKKVLVLSYHNHPAEGHAFSRYKAIKDKGYDAYFFSLISLPGTPVTNSFLDKNHRFSLLYLWFIIKLNLSRLFNKRIANTGEYNFLNYSNFYAIKADTILRKTLRNPDVIIIGWSDFFISPKTIYDLYQKTKAKIVIPMVDAHILGGGCHYPCACNQYISGCQSCPAIKCSRTARKLYNEKQRFLTNTPFVLAGTSYDLNRAKKVPFLKDKEMLRIVSVPDIPFYKNKEEVRSLFGIGKNSFVIMCGAVSFSDKRKGFKYLLKTLEYMNQQKCNDKTMTLLLIGGNADKLQISNKNISVVETGFLNLNQLFEAFYASDVFLSFSIDDSGPYMINYSIACGIPVISFPVGIALDLVKHRETGYLAKYLDAKDFANGILEFYNLPIEKRKQISKNCVNLMNTYKKFTPWFLKVLE